MLRDSLGTKILAVVTAVFLAYPVAPAHADADEARRLFKKAKTAYGNGEFDKAAKLLEEAYSEEANLIYQYNRIRALEGAERYEEALKVLETYEQPMLDAEGFEDISDIKESLEEKVGPTDEPDEPSEPKTTTSDSGKTKEIIGWSLLGLGGASGITGFLFGSSLLLPKEIRDGQPNATQKEFEADRQTINQHKTMTIVFSSIGLASAIAGTVLVLTARRGKDEISTAAHLPGKVTVQPFFRGDAAGATLDVQF